STSTTTSTTTTAGSTGDPCPKPEQVICDGACVSTELNIHHCGGCDQPCLNTHVCVSGECVLNCPIDQQRCGESCVDTDVDPAHCGGCDLPCDPGQFCVDGGCVLTCPKDL